VAARRAAVAEAGAGGAATPSLDDATLDAIAARVAGRVQVSRDPGVQVRPGMVVKVRRPGPGACFYEEVKLETDRVFKLRGTRNDEKLVRLGFLEVYEGDTFACRVCGGEFATQRGRDNHGYAEHEPKTPRGIIEVPLQSPLHRERTTFTEDEVAMEHARAAAVRQGELAEEATERRLNEEAPLYLDKTAASQK